MAEPDPLFTFRMVPIIATRLAVGGVDPQAMLRVAGLPEAAMQGDVTAPLSRIAAFVDAAAARFGDPEFGASLAEWIPTGAFGFPEFVVRSAPTLKIALQSLCDFAALINPIGRFTFAVEPKHAVIEYVVRGRRGGLSLHLNEYTLHLLVRLGQTIIDDFTVERAWLPHHRADGADRIAVRLGYPVELGAPTVGFAIPRNLLDRRPRQADEALHAFLCEQSRQLLARTGTDDVVSRLIRVLDDRLATGALDVEKVARSMAMTSRSLQRRLDAAGTTYREVLDHVRHRRCRELRRAGWIWDDIAVALGFSDARSLRRAAARWEEPE